MAENRNAQQVREITDKLVTIRFSSPCRSRMRR